MSAATLAAFIARCRRLCQPRSHLPDAELLRRFTQQRDADAFAQLLERYAGLVWGICRRILVRESDCEDAFQATFLALLRRPPTPPSPPLGEGRVGASLGAWLHTIAVRVAHRTLTRSRRLQPSPTIAEQATTNDVADEVGSRELFRIVDEEIERLPATVRAPLILCCLEGRTRDEAAGALGCSTAAVKSRLERGRDLLRRRLGRRGVQLPAAFLVLGLTGQRIRAALWAKTMQAALHSPPASIGALAEAALPALTVGKGKLILAALLLAASAVGVAGTILAPHAEEPPLPSQRAKTAAEPKKPQAPQVRTDRHGDPLPDGAIARLGTVRWRHGDFVHALAYSPDGKTIATTGVGRALVLWDAASGKELRVFPSRGQPRSVAFSPDGKRIATDHRMGQVWEVATGKLLWERKNVQSVATAVAFSPDGKTLATANSDKAVHLWDTANDKELRRIDCGQGYVNAVAYSPDGKLLASAGEDGTIRLWDAVMGKEVRRIIAAKKAIRSIAFSPDGKQLAAGSDEEALSLWDTATGRQIRVLGDKQVQFSPVAFSPDGKLLAAGYGDGTFRLWDAASGEEKRHWHAGAWRARSLAFSPDGKTLATAVLWDGGIRLWDVATGRERNAVEGHHGPIHLLRFAADKTTLISAGLDRSLLWWDLATQTPRRRFSWTTESFSDMALSPDGNIIAVGDHVTYEVWLWDVRTGKSAKLPGKHQKWIQSIVFSPDGKLVASGGRDDAIHVWDAREGKEVRQIKGIGSQNSMKLLFSPDGSTLACGTLGFGSEVHLRLWDVASGKERRAFDNKGADISPDAFSPDGKVLATANNPQGSREAFVRLVDMTTGRELCRHGGHHGGIGAVAFSPDGKLVVSGCVGEDEDNSIHVWEAATGRLIRRFEGHHSWVWAVTFAADGLTVASGAGDSTVLVWDITDRQKDGKLRRAALTPRQLEECWTALANEDAAKAYNAVWALVAAPEQAVPFLQKHLPPASRPDAKTVARLIADLDSDDFKVRQKSVEELGNFGDAITPALQGALDGKPSLEVRRRLLQLLDRTRDWTPERLRPHRAIQALEHMNTVPARQVLQLLADGAPGASCTEEAKTALLRLGRSPAPKKN
jgi:RNA polymerase sigma factor (sigma-70 family)